jgi:hypothetical protein
MINKDAAMHAQQWPSPALHPESHDLNAIDNLTIFD